MLSFGIDQVAAALVFAGYAILKLGKARWTIGLGQALFFGPLLFWYLQKFFRDPVIAALVIVDFGLVAAGVMIMREASQRGRQYDWPFLFGALMIIVGLAGIIGTVFILGNPAAFGAGFGVFTRCS